MYAALPFIGLWLNMNISPMIADLIRSAGIMNTTTVRKVFNTVGKLLDAVEIKVCNINFALFNW